MNWNIPFNRPYSSGDELKNIAKAISNGDLSGNGDFTGLCETYLQTLIGSPRVLLTPSCTDALELAALLIGIEEGDEVIMTSFNFVSAANAFVLRGAKIIFVDIRPDTMNIDENLIEAAITPQTKAILAMHYAGVGCEMKKIMDIAQEHQLYVIEDAAHCIAAYYHDKHLGSIGHLGTISFHSTKNIHCGEGGALLINDESLIERAEIIREKGTNRKQFENKIVEKYSWVDVGSSYLMNELSAAFLFAQLNNVDRITFNRINNWQLYFSSFSDLVHDIELPFITNQCRHNAHIFFLKCQDAKLRNRLISYLKKVGIQSVFHYVPLHSTKGGLKYGRYVETLMKTERESERLLRLPLFYDLTSVEVLTIVACIKDFFKDRNHV